MRVAAFLLLGLAGFALPAIACDLRLEGRPADVAAYVETARPCLQNPPLGYSFEAQLEDAFLRKVNEERRRAGLAPVSLRAELRDAARFHSLDMAVNGFFGHVSPDHRQHDDRIAALDRTALADFTAENVATVSRPAGHIGGGFALKRLHANLMDSPGHQENILHPKATHVAFGVVRTREGVWVTQLFMRLSGTLPEEVPLRLRAEEAVQAPSGLTGWEFVRYDMVAPSGQPAPLTRVEELSGNARLAAYATQPGDDPLSYYWMRFPGPSVTLTR